MMTTNGNVFISSEVKYIQKAMNQGSNTRSLLNDVYHTRVDTTSLSPSPSPSPSRSPSSSSFRPSSSASSRPPSSSSSRSLASSPSPSPYPPSSRSPSPSKLSNNSSPNLHSVRPLSRSSTSSPSLSSSSPSLLSSSPRSHNKSPSIISSSPPRSPIPLSSSSPPRSPIPLSSSSPPRSPIPLSSQSLFEDYITLDDNDVFYRLHFLEQENKKLTQLLKQGIQTRKHAKERELKLQEEVALLKSRERDYIHELDKIQADKRQLLRQIQSLEDRVEGDTSSPKLHRHSTNNNRNIINNTNNNRNTFNNGNNYNKNTNDNKTLNNNNKIINKSQKNTNNRMHLKLNINEDLSGELSPISNPSRPNFYSLPSQSSAQSSFHPSPPSPSLRPSPPSRSSSPPHDPPSLSLETISVDGTQLEDYVATREYDDSLYPPSPTFEDISTITDPFDDHPISLRPSSNVAQKLGSKRR